MHNLEFYIIQEKKVISRGLQCGHDSETYSSIDDIHKQAKLLNVDYILNTGELKDIPRTTDSFLFCVFGVNCLVPTDFLSKILSINNLHRDASCFCGPRISRTSRVNLELANFLKLYHNYSLDSFSTFISCYILCFSSKGSIPCN